MSSFLNLTDFFRNDGNSMAHNLRAGNNCIVLTVAKFVGNDESNRTDYKLSIYIYYNNIHYQLNCFRGIGQESRSLCLKILYIF